MTAEEQKGYDAAIEAIKQALQAAKDNSQLGSTSGSQSGMQQPNSQGGQGGQGNQSNQQNQSGLNTSINPSNNNGPMSKAASQGQSGQGQQGQGQGQSGNGGAGGQGGMQINMPQPGGQQGGSGSMPDMSSGKQNIPGGSQTSAASRQARSGEVSDLGGTFIDKKTGQKLAEEAGYKDSDLGTDEDVSSKWRSVGEEVVRAAQGSGIGTGRGSRLGQLLNNIYKPIKNWKAELKKFVGHAIGRHTSTGWGRKQFLQNDEIRRYDRLHSDAIESVVFMIDTSGSNIGMLEIAVSEAYHIVMAKKVQAVTFVYYDYGVCDYEVLTNAKNFNPKKLKKSSGGGGTSYKKAIDDMTRIIASDKKIKHGQPKVDILMTFTDGDTCEEVTEKPKWCKNAMAVITDRPSAQEFKWCKTLYIDKEDLKK